MIKRVLKKYNDIPIAAKATIWFIFCSSLQKCISLITTPIFTRLMTTEQYGQFSIYNSWLQIFTIFTTLRLNWGVFSKGMSKYKNDRDGYTSTMQTVTFILAAMAMCIYLVFRKQINALTELPTFIMVAIFAELLVTPAIDFWSIRKRFDYIYKPVVFRTLLMVVLNTVIGIIAVFFLEEKGYARILTCIGVNICFGIGLFAYNLKKGKKILCWEYAKFALTFNLPLLLHYISQYILDQFDRIMIQKMVSIAAAGIYSVAYNAGAMMKIVTQSINNALVPWIYEKLENKEFKQLDNVMFLVYVVVAICAVGFSLFAPEIMMVLADERYHEAIYTIPPVTIGMVFLFIYTTFANVEIYFDQNRFAMFISMIGALLNIGLNYVFIWVFGYIAAAYTTLFCYIVFAASHYIYMTNSVKRILGQYVFNTTRLVGLSVAILLAGIGVVFMYDKIVVRYFVILILMVSIFVFRKQLIGALKTSLNKGKGKNA